ncbi:unnamed protein product [Pleuronectes platessa]|uniref:Uncharacterized protein n=1 Tax=Pleuronectes platessa TaxID=8262 RepID=A0A9N7Y686_PLEPL|nr:unnamed protein product [Pleuronectes platessa]
MYKHRLWCVQGLCVVLIDCNAKCGAFRSIVVLRRSLFYHRSSGEEGGVRGGSGEADKRRLLSASSSSSKLQCDGGPADLITPPSPTTPGLSAVHWDVVVYLRGGFAPGSRSQRTRLRSGAAMDAGRSGQINRDHRWV